MRRARRWGVVAACGTAAVVVAALAYLPGHVERGLNTRTPHPPFEITTEAQALHDSLIIADWHADTLMWKRDLLVRSDRGHVDLPRLQDGNVAVQVFTAVTKSPSGLNYDTNAADAPDDITRLAMVQLWPPRTWTSLAERALFMADRLHGFARRSDGALRVVTTATELEAALADRASGRQVTAAILGLEGGHALEGVLANLDRMEAAGYRVIGLQHFFDNELGGSLHGTGNPGLTEFGRAVVSEIERRGMVLDLAHSSPRVAAEALAMTDMPVIVSHTGIYSHCQVKRNFADLLMLEVARTGGVVGIGYWSDVTCDDSPEGVAGAIRAAVDLLGEDHVSLGSDYDGTVRVSFDTSELAALTQALQARGLTEAQIRKVMGENTLRVLRARLAP